MKQVPIEYATEERAREPQHALGVSPSADAKRYLIVRVHEVALKGRNRWRFVEQLKSNLRAVMSDLGVRKIIARGSRLEVELPEQVNDDTVIERAKLVFGAQNFSIARVASPDLGGITQAALQIVEGARAASFAVRASRSDKRLPFTSVDVEREVGAAVKARLNCAVDLTEPQLTVVVEVSTNHALVSLNKRAGAGGLPVGISGKALALLSGGLDSPVAAYRMMRRGLRLDFVHFHSYPLLSGASRDKARELTALLARYQAGASLILVPFADAQRQVVARVERPLRVVLYRRLMMRIAGRLARNMNATALVTGESLGQVASQTLDNMAIIAETAPIPVLRPLLGMDKNEIVQQTRELGTFEISILPDQDCCTLFVPRNPATRARAAEVAAAESRLDLEQMVEQACAHAERLDFRFPERSMRNPA
jgi:thiamine biosynthesis protein ThiI